MYVSTTVVRMDEFMLRGMYVQLFVWMDGYTGECMHVLGFTRGWWMLIGFLLAKMCCFFCETSLK